MNGAWMRRLALAGAALVATAVAVGGGSAGQRAALVTFEAFPGPGMVNYGEFISYRFTFENTSGTTLTKVMARQSVPVAASQHATFVASTCPSTPTTITTSSGPEWICDFGNQPADAPPLALTVVWKVPTLASTDNCVDCLVSNGRFTTKDGPNDVTDLNDAFPPGGLTVTATLLAAGAGGGETLLAGGYETTSVACTNPTDPGNLQTNPVISLANPVSTTACFPPFVIPPTNLVDLGFAAVLRETAGNARHTEVCIAALGTNCGATYLDATFGAPYVTHIIHVADGALPKGYRITGLSHNGNPPLEEGECSGPGECVLLIDLDPQTKIWTLIATSDTNGLWDW